MQKVKSLFRKPGARSMRSKVPPVADHVEKKKPPDLLSELKLNLIFLENMLRSLEGRLSVLDSLPKNCELLLQNTKQLQLWTAAAKATERELGDRLMWDLITIIDLCDRMYALPKFSAKFLCQFNLTSDETQRDWLNRLEALRQRASKATKSAIDELKYWETSGGQLRSAGDEGAASGRWTLRDSNRTSGTGVSDSGFSDDSLLSGSSCDLRSPPQLAPKLQAVSMHDLVQPEPLSPRSVDDDAQRSKPTIAASELFDQVNLVAQGLEALASLRSGADYFAPDERASAADGDVRSDVHKFFDDVLELAKERPDALRCGQPVAEREVQIGNTRRIVLDGKEYDCTPFERNKITVKITRQMPDGSEQLLEMQGDDLRRLLSDLTLDGALEPDNSLLVQMSRSLPRADDVANANVPASVSASPSPSASPTVNTVSGSSLGTLSSSEITNKELVISRYMNAVPAGADDDDAFATAAQPPANVPDSPSLTALNTKLYQQRFSTYSLFGRINELEPIESTDTAESMDSAESPEPASAARAGSTQAEGGLVRANGQPKATHTMTHSRSQSLPLSAQQSTVSFVFQNRVPSGSKLVEALHATPQGSCRDSTSSASSFDSQPAGSAAPSPARSRASTECTDVVLRTDVRDLIGFNRDGRVQSGSVEALVVYACSVSNDFRNVLFLEAFLATYRTFVTSSALIDLLYRRLTHFLQRTVQPTYTRKTLTLLIRVVADLILSELTDDIFERLLSILLSVYENGLVAEAVILRKEIIRKVEERQTLNEGYVSAEEDRYVCQVLRERNEYPGLLSSFKLEESTDTLEPADETFATACQHLLQMPAQLLAEQLTKLEVHLFQRVEIPEIMIFAKLNSAKFSPNMWRLSSYFNRLSMWCVTLILRPQSQAERVAFVTKFIELAQCLRTLNNFNSMIGVALGFMHSSVQRLRDQFPQRVTADMQRWSQLIDVTALRKLYVDACDSLDTDCLPFIGGVIKGACMLHETMLDCLADSLVNFDKRWALFQKLEIIRRLKHWKYAGLRFEPHVLQCIAASWDLSQLYDSQLAADRSSQLLSSTNGGVTAF